ncbi:MAG TPA: DUF4242 domain-containing protein [Anaerolineales bacterium]|nr:DUF4242 domain-containing protein [Anaerolineales bacterium]HLF03343.1 DUF4242 domain-containing protein [Anaerolineales bacterium]
MPRYLIEQTFPERLNIPANAEGVQIVQAIIGNDVLDSVTWIHSYVSADKRKTFCICDAPTPEAVRHAAQRNGLPVDRITEVRVLDPYFYL